MRMLLAGNWKMNGLRAALAEVRALARALADRSEPADVVVCPPATLIGEAVKALESSRIAVGGQDCHAQSSGAFTGDVSAEMLRDAGATWVIVGHSERRHYHRETDADVAAKLRAAGRAGLSAILCVGESEAERDAGKTLSVVSAQIANGIPEDAAGPELVIAYEPIWAIGTGRTPTVTQIAEAHGAIRDALARRFGDSGKAMRILYGGSVKPDNAAAILAVEGVDGALVGGASLRCADFLSIIRSVPGG